MKHEFALYRPVRPRLPWLAVVVTDDKPSEVFGFSDRRSAARGLLEMRARLEAKEGSSERLDRTARPARQPRFAWFQ
jgi:hypothetical protein